MILLNQHGIGTGICMDKVIVTMGDKNFFHSIAVSALLAYEKHPEIQFNIYDWGLSDKQLDYLIAIPNVTIRDWKNNFVQNPFPKPSNFSRVFSPFRSSANVGTKLHLARYTLENIFSDKPSFEWLYAQKPYVVKDLSSHFENAFLLFLDGDALLNQDLNELFSFNENIMVTLRDEKEIDFSFGHCQVLNAGVFAIQGSKIERDLFFNSWISYMHSKFEFLMEQSSLTRYVFSNNLVASKESIQVLNDGLSVRLLDWYNYNYNKIENGICDKNKIIHFKGGRHSKDVFYKLAKEINITDKLDDVYRVVD